MLNFSKLKIAIVSILSLIAILLSIPSIVPQQKLPAFFKSFPKMNLGLDLRGGSQLMLEVDFDSYFNEQIINLRNEIRSEFINNKIRAVPEITSDGIIYRLSDKAMADSAKSVIKKIDRSLNVKSSGNQFNVYFSDQDIAMMKQKLIKQSIEIVRRRVDETGTKEPTIQSSGNMKILLQFPGVENPDEIKAILGKTAKMTFHFVRTSQTDGAQNSFDTRRVYDDSGAPYLIDSEVVLSGDLLVDATATYYEGKPAVSFRFNEIGSRKFADITRENIGRIFAIVLDDKVVTAPRINTIINQGSGVISGNFTAAEASSAALLLRAGALPAPLKVIEERSVGPSLGSDSIKAGFSASIAAMIMVGVIMCVFYGIFGIIANIAMAVNVAILISILAMMNATLTLPGIAGIVLTMCMSVDSNVLIYERIKEELRESKSLLNATSNGFHHAYRTIIDSNLTTLIVGVLLYIFGSGSVKGFAVALCIGILSSMFSAILFARMLVVLWIRARNLSKANASEVGLL